MLGSCFFLLFLSFVFTATGDSVELVRINSQIYLDQYFDVVNKDVRPAVESGLPSDLLRQAVVACIDLAKSRMQQFRVTYEEESVVAANRLNVREDDALRLFYMGDIVACLQHVDATAASQYVELPRAQRASFFPPNKRDELFTRSSSTPVMLSVEQHASFASVLDRYLTVGGVGDKPAWMDKLDVFQYLPLSFLAGTIGQGYCVAIIVALLGGLYALRCSPVAESQSTRVTPTPSPIAASPGTSKVKRVQKKK